jgi:3' exoribonuclease, RNase T-like
MFVFADTEFTDFKNTELISLGLVSEDAQHEFYREVSHIADFRSDFVNQVVIPLCDRDFKHPDIVALDLKEWLDALPGDYVIFVVDYVGDWHLIEPLLKKQPTHKKVYVKMYNFAFWHMLNERGHNVPQASQGRVMNTLMNGVADYYLTDPRQHHALVDAKANRHGWLKGYEAAK